MRHRVGGSKLGRNPAHRRATLRNLVTNVLERERVHTTLLRARAAQPLVERMITLGKRDTLHTRRQAAAFLQAPHVLKKLFNELAPRFAERSGGYTRVVRAGFRHGDNAAAAVLELLGSEFKKKEKETKGAKEKAEEKEEGK